MSNPLAWGTVDGPKREDRNSWAAKMARKAAEENRAARVVQSLGMRKINDLYAELIDLLRNGDKAEPTPVLDELLRKAR